MIHDGPLVATFHMAHHALTRMLAMFDTMLQPFLEKLSGRIAVSTAARKVIVGTSRRDAVVISRMASRSTGSAPPSRLPQFAGYGQTVSFIGRYDETRKGMQVLIAALGPARPEPARISSSSSPDGVTPRVPASPAGCRPRSSDRAWSGQRTDEGEPAPHRRPVLAPPTRTRELWDHPARGDGRRGPDRASDLEAFRRVLSDGRGRSVVSRLATPKAWRSRWTACSDDRRSVSELAAAGTRAVAPFDWSVIVAQVVRVYELAIAVPATGR
jgi:phosphatidylinositol alpha-mannosyltransferase